MEFEAINSRAPELRVELRNAAKAEAFEDNSLASFINHRAYEWASCNRAVYGDRYVPLKQITAQNAKNLLQICEYNTGLKEAFESGLIMIDGQLIFSTAKDVISIDTVTCQENWRAHQESRDVLLSANRGVEYVDGKVVRGYWDGYVRAFGEQSGGMIYGVDS